MGSANSKYFKHHFNSCGECRTGIPACPLHSRTDTVALSAWIELIVLNLEGNTSASCLGRFHLQLKT